MPRFDCLRTSLRAFALVASLSLGASAARKSSVPMKDALLRRSAAAIGASSAQTCAPGFPCHMLYYGGKVVPNAKVYVVNWTAGVLPGGDLGAFYDAVTNSSYLDWLNEYDTDITPTGSGGAASGTTQFIGRGVYAGTFTITPSAANASGTCPASGLPPGTTTCIIDAQIESELDAQIAAGRLPAADENALYMTYFPPHTFISVTKVGSCVTGGFCGYHGTVQNAAREFYYGVLPDHGRGSGCDTGCGSDPNLFNNLTSTSAHELAEAITDAEVGLNLTSRLAWYDFGGGGQNENGEIGDMCRGTSVVAGFTVQQVFSNLVAANPDPAIAAAACVSSRTARDDFSISLASNRAKVNGGRSISVPIAVASTSGSPGAVTLSFSGLPPSVTGSLDVTTATPGSTGATLTLTADPGAVAVKGAVVQLKGADAAGSLVHTAGLLLDVGPLDDFALNVTPPAAGTRIGAGKSAAYTVTTSAIGAFTAPISLAVSGLPDGVTSAFSPAAVTPGQSSTLTFTVAIGTAPRPAAPITVSGTAGSLVNDASSSVGIAPSGFGLTLTPPSSVNLAPGTSADWTIATTDVSGAAETIALAVGALPAGVHGSLASATVTAGAGTTLTLSADATAGAVAATSFAVTGTAASGAQQATSTVGVTGAVASDFSLSLAPGAVTVAPGQTAQVQVVTALVSGAAQSVALSAAGLPSGVTASFSPSSVTAGGTAALTLSAASNAPAVTSAAYTVTGTSGAATHGAGGSISIVPPSPPTVSITHPTDGATVSGAVEIDAAAAASAGTSLLKIDLLVDGVVVTSLAQSPAQGFWQSTGSTEGTHTVTARAVDTSGGSTLSAPVSVTVQNTSGRNTTPGGGCASGGAGLSALFGLLVSLRRRRVT